MVNYEDGWYLATVRSVSAELGVYVQYTEDKSFGYVRPEDIDSHLRIID